MLQIQNLKSLQTKQQYSKSTKDLIETSHQIILHEISLCQKQSLYWASKILNSSITF